MHVIFPYGSECLVYLKMPLPSDCDSKEKKNKRRCGRDTVRKWKGGLKWSLRSTPTIFSIESPFLNQPDVKQESQNLKSLSSSRRCNHRCSCSSTYAPLLLHCPSMLRKRRKEKRSPRCRRSEKEPWKEQLWDVKVFKLDFKNSLPWWAEPEAEGETRGAPGLWWGISCRPGEPARRKPWCWS